jgi:hypothetical protein
MTSAMEIFERLTDGGSALMGTAPLILPLKEPGCSEAVIVFPWSRAQLPTGNCAGSTMAGQMKACHFGSAGHWLSEYRGCGKSCGLDKLLRQHAFELVPSGI